MDEKKRMLLQRMIWLVVELCEIRSTEPFDLDAYNLVLSKVNKLGNETDFRKRRKPWLSHFIILFLLGVLAWVVLHISC